MCLLVWKNALTFISHNHTCKQGLYPCVSKRGKDVYSCWGFFAQSRGLLPSSMRSSSNYFKKSLAKDVGLRLQQSGIDCLVMISEQAFLGIFLRPCWLGSCLFWRSLVLCRKSRWRAVTKPAALQVTAGSIFLPFLSFPLCLLLLPTLSCFSLYAVTALLHEGVETFWGRREAIFGFLLALLIEPSVGRQIYPTCVWSWWWTDIIWLTW